MRFETQVDFDSEDVYQELRSLGFGEAFDATVLARTKKGYHVWWRRTPLCDELNLTDGPTGGERNEAGKVVKFPMDIKTLTASSTMIKGPDGQPVLYFTPGFCAVFPSSNKVWVRSPFLFEGGVEMQPVPDAFARWLHAKRASAAGPAKPPATKKRAASSAAKPEQEAKRPVALREFYRPCRLHFPCLAKMGFKTALLYDIKENLAMNERTRDAGYEGTIMWLRYPDGLQCPLCGKPDGHLNEFWIGHMPDGSRHIKNYSENCKPPFRTSSGKLLPGNYHKSVEIPWSAAGLRGWLAAMRDQGVRLSPAALARLADQVQAFGEPRNAFVYKGELLVFETDAGPVAVGFGLRLASCGWPRAGLTKTPWLGLPANACFLPVPAEFFEQLAVMK